MGRDRSQDQTVRASGDPPAANVAAAISQSRGRRRGLLALLLLTLLCSGCAKKAAPTVAVNSGGYTGALDTAYEGALDAASQLALGTLMLEESEYAVSAEQAADLLPLWQILSGSAIEGELERAAVLRRIESTMTASQVAAIREMRLTQESIQAWMQASGMQVGGSRGQGGSWPGTNGTDQGGRPGAGGNLGNMTEEERTQMREQFQNASPEELATRRAQFATQGRPGGQTGIQVPGMTSSSGTSSLLARAVVALLSRKAGVALSGPAATRVRATATPTQTSIPQPTATATTEPTAILDATVLPTATPEPATTPEPTAQATATQGVVSQATPVVPTTLPSAAATPLPPLEQIENTDPGPPFTIAVSRNTMTQDPLVEQSRQIQITGWVRNDGERTYAVSRIGVTFYDADGFRGVFVPGIRDGKIVSGEWLWHGAMDADFGCLLLAPGEVCPFSVEITAQNMASFLLYAEAAPTERESVPVVLSNVRTSQDLTDYVRIQGTATNTSDLAVKNVIVSGALVDASGQMVRVGSTLVLEEDISPGASVAFDLRIRKADFVDYQLYAQAERDWD